MPKRPADRNKLAKLIVDITTGVVDELRSDDKKRAAIEARRKGGLKGGKSRAKSLTSEQKSAIASMAANVRWKKRGH